MKDATLDWVLLPACGEDRNNADYILSDLTNLPF